MPYLFLVVSVFMSASSSIFGKFYNKKTNKKDSSALYNFLLLVSVFLCWGVLYSIKFSFEITVIGYSLLFAICYSACNIGIINALIYGSAMLTSLFVNLSLILTTVWGFVFWKAEITIFVVLGLILVILSIFLCLFTKKKDEKSVSLKWLVYVIVAFLGNAGCSIVQRTQQIRFDGEHGNMLMFFATGISALASFLIYDNSDKTDTKTVLKYLWWIPVCAGVCNVVLNMFVMILSITDLSPSLIYPVIGVGGLIVVMLFSLLLFSEKLKWWQWLGIAIGSIAVILLSI